MTLNETDFEVTFHALGLADVDQLGLLNQEIVRQLKIARRIKGAEVARELTIGAKVRLPANAKPKYLANQLGTVTAIKERRATIQLERGPMGKFRSGSLLCPFEMLTVI